MKKYNIGFWYTEYCSKVIEANSEEEAEEKIMKHLEMNGLDNLEYNTTMREYHTEGGYLEE